MSEEGQDAITLTRVWIRENIIVTVLAFFIVISLIIHAVTILTLWRVRDVVRLQLTTAAEQVAAAQKQQVHYDFPIKQDFPFSTTIAISEAVDIQIRDTFPIKQQFPVPIDLNSIIPGAGSYTVTVPVDITVPVSTTVRVPIRRQIPFATTIHIDTNVPLNLDLKQPPLGNLLKQIETSLRSLRQKL